MVEDDLAVREGQLLERLQGYRQEVLEFTRELISTDSANPPGDERAVAELVVGRLHQLGIQDVETVGPEEERPSVVARVSGASDGSNLILSGHIDTKPAGDLEAWETDPWDPVILEDRLYGLGSGDMKAAVAAMVYAAAGLQETGLPSGTLQLVLTADEEAGSVKGAKWMAEQGLLAADAAIIGEPSGITEEWEALHLVSRGAALFKIVVRGTQMHSSITDRLPSVNASVKMAELMVRMDKGLKDRLTYPEHPLSELGPTVNVGVMVDGGVFYGICPGRAEFACDIRTLPNMTEDALIADLQAFLDVAMADDPELDAELRFETWVGATEIKPDEPVIDALLSASGEVLGSVPRLEAFPGATDAPHFQTTAGIPTVAAFGPGLLPLAHSPNEYLEVASVEKAMCIYALASARFLAGTDQGSR